VSLPGAVAHEQESEAMQTTLIPRDCTTDAKPVESRPNDVVSARPARRALAVVTIQDSGEDEGKLASSALVCFRCRRVYCMSVSADAPSWCDCGETLSRLPTTLFDSMPPVAQLDAPVPSLFCTQPLMVVEHAQNDHPTPPAIASEMIVSSGDTSPYAPSFHAAPPPPPTEVIRRYRAEIRKKYLVMLCCVLLAIAIWLNLILVHWR
jgi:hypothetical protein